MLQIYCFTSIFFIINFSVFSAEYSENDLLKLNSEQDNLNAPPNILFIAIDDLNDWLGYMEGHPNSRTPNMDRLASKGVLFQNAHCQAPLCGPSRASIMSGLRPSSTGIYGMVDDDKIKEDNENTSDIVFLPKYLKNHGYHTMGIGKLFHQHAPEGQFDESGGRAKGFGPVPDQRFVWEGNAGENYGRTSTDWGAYPLEDSLMPDYQSAQWAVERINREYEKPFFLAVGFLRPHVPWYVPQPWFDLHPVEDLVMPPFKKDDLNDVPEIAHQINDLPMMPTTDWAIKSGNWEDIVQSYLACVSFVDDQVGKLLDALENSAYAENTIIVLWSDHGYSLGEKNTFAKHSLWEEATHAPLMMAGPGIPEGKVVTEPVELLSIYPTLLEITGLPQYERNEGRSLVPLIKGEKSDKEWYAITTYGMNNHSIRTEQFRYTQYEDGSEEFYDHSNDPNEWNNLAGKTAQQDKMNSIKKYLPKVNVPWTKHSSYAFQPYFVDQKHRSDRGLIK